MADLEKRKRIMARSMKLGHCICNPKQPCPCPTFKEKNICLCAGERPHDLEEDVQLTKFVENAGCASKINQNDLKKILAGLPKITDPRILVSSNTCDDAGIFKLNEKEALVLTVDVFTPNVDDPYTFGQIAAANSLSDIYAMGGKPLTALSVIGFPIEELSPRVMNRIIRGGLDKVAEAGAVVIGGHSINDRDVKFGFAVTGMIDPSKIIANSNAKPGDVLVLTKPIGVGVISFARQMDRVSDEAMSAAARSMAALNSAASEVMQEIHLDCATDVTGFGLLGHLSEMVAQSGVTVEVYADQVPVFDEALALVKEGLISGAIERNREYASQYVIAADDVGDEMQYILYDPQTSGGLLMTVVEEKADEVIERLKEKGVEHASIIGRVLSKSDGRILIKKSPASKTPKLVETKKEAATHAASELSCCEEPPEPECCASPAEASEEVSMRAGAPADAPCCESPPEIAEEETGAHGEEEHLPSDARMREKFSAFMKEVNAEGAIGLRNKELIAVALSLLAKCEPCTRIHIKKARSMGISQAAIDEAVWMAVSFGGAPIMMFYNAMKEKA
jgi:selenide,water dikinase